MTEEDKLENLNKIKSEIVRELVNFCTFSQSEFFLLLQRGSVLSGLYTPYNRGGNSNWGSYDGAESKVVKRSYKEYYSLPGSLTDINPRTICDY